MNWREALEAFADERNWRLGGRFDPNSPNFDGVKTAQEALADLENDDLDAKVEGDRRD
jgi:hypothetical protein